MDQIVHGLDEIVDIAVESTGSIYRSLREAILRNDPDVQPGARLREGALAESYGVSRTPIREVLRRLEADGLVRMEPRRGAVVMKFELDELDEIYDIRLALETLAATRAVAYITADDLKEARTALAAASRALPSNDAEAMALANDAFHRSVYRASHAPRLTALIFGLGDIIRRYRVSSLSAPGRAAEVLREHSSLLDAIERSDVVAIKDLMMGHIDRARNAALRMQLEQARAERTRTDSP